MKKNDFAQYITAFLTKHLAGERNLSGNTIASYRDAFVMLIKFMNEKKAFNRQYEVSLLACYFLE